MHFRGHPLLQTQLDRIKWSDRTVVVELKEALYGCVESAKLWYDEISSDLTQLGYKVNPSDICVLNRTELDSTQTTLVIHVDDMMISSRDEKRIDSIISEIER